MALATKRRPTFLLRLIAFCGKLSLDLIYKLNKNLYMKLYTRFLSWLGITISGRPTYISPKASIDSSDYTAISLGDKCVISGGVRLLTHDYSINRIAVFKNPNETREFRVIKKISIGMNSFIGAQSIIMPGVTIGKNVIVGAGSVVTRDVEDNVIVAGNPARKISTIDEYWDKAQNDLFRSDIYCE